MLKMTSDEEDIFTAFPSNEINTLARSVDKLETCGWYHGDLCWRGAKNLLKDAKLGSFLVRNSENKNFLFSISVQTDKGPISIRIHYEWNMFRIDCIRKQKFNTPRFNCVIELVQYYSSVCNGVWMELCGTTHSPAIMKIPWLKRPHSLMHTARLVINRSFLSDSNDNVEFFKLPEVLLRYLNAYSYKI
ncbi:Maph125 [Matsumuraeses phaseoli granulovirus]|uniref:Maph125 n=1 Tax=Matsumuraeses phaseoli granulovirus TaxID=2760664 RepID=A0AAE7SXS9_9BBAC|nr:Maph125 [Matsumuraeses phaseoli granulovirus]QOD40088.1 Maph125 [Matsumuraeses phaseoli granulovirus]